MKTPLDIRFLGNFEHASTYPPALKFNNRSYRASQITTQELKFSVPPAVIFPEGYLNARQNYLWRRRFELPYPGTLWRQALATFHLTIGILPSLPGKITLNYQTQKHRA